MRSEQKEQTQNDRIFFSIITVVYELDNDFWTTVENIALQECSVFEWIIKPAKPVTDADIARLDAFDIPYILVSNEDSGIYSAMNIAVSRSRGLYIFFLNSGDCFSDPDTLKRVCDEILNRDWPSLVYGQATVGSVEYNYPERLTRFFLFRNALCHQSYFASRSLFSSESSFDESFRILADHEFVLRNLDAIICSHHRLSFSVSCVPEMGFSARNIQQKRWERRKMLWHYFPPGRYLGFHLRYALTFPAVRDFLFRFRWYRTIRNKLLNY